MNTRLMRMAATLAMALALSALARSVGTTAPPPEVLSGGATTVFDDTRNAFSLPARNLREDHRPSFFVGNSYFNQNWVIAPASTSGRDGLGPLFNARSCSACHFKDGRSRPPEPGEPMSTMLLRISVPGAGEHGAPKADPVYGDQIQGQSIPGVPREADVFVDYTEMAGAFADGEAYSLRRPAYRITAPGFGPLSRQLLVSPRVSPGVIGLGLLEAVPEATLLRLADPRDTDGDGISGRPNVVWNVESGVMAVGRFGWKAEQPTVAQQTAAAFVGDIGITSPLFPHENHSAKEPIPVRSQPARSPEVSEQIFRAVSLYARSLAVPAARTSSPGAIQGRNVFSSLRCDNCHVAALETGPSPELPEFAHQRIRPYTDLLLHDMGDGLADDRPAFLATGREWRTPPLWGLGLIKKVNGHTFLLHDGRARNTSEAILWHGGEAAAARERFRQLSKSDRAALVAFLDSL